MRHALVIARRELAEKRFVALAAMAFAVLPFLLSTIPGIRGRNGAGDIIATGAGLLAIGFTGGLALILGGNVIGRDLAENRLSFYFSRPLGAASIWFGKVAAALLLIFTTFAIIVVPARLVAARSWARSWGGNGALLTLALVGGAVVLFFLAHVVGSFVRSRSAWIAVDFVALCVAAFVVYLILSPLAGGGAPQATKVLAIAIGCGVGVALVGGGAWQLARGRTDRKRSHLALSQFIWVVVAATLAVVGAFVIWMMSATPNDIRDLAIGVPRPGSWVILGGTVRGRMDYVPDFVYNLDSGAYSRIPAGNLWRADLTGDGKTLVVARANRKSGTMQILQRPVDVGVERSTGLTLHIPSQYVLTANGDRIAADDYGTLTVYDVRGKRSLGSARLPDNAGDTVAMYFAASTLVRLVMVNSRGPTATYGLRIQEFDTDRRSFQQTGEFARGSLIRLMSANHDGSRLLARDGGMHVFVLDGRTAAVQATLDTPNVRDATFLRDGGIAVSRKIDSQMAIDFFDARGAFLRSMPLAVAYAAQMRALRDGRLILAVRQKDKPLETAVVDPSNGALQRIPAASLAGYSWYPHDPRRAPIDMPAYFFQKGHLVRWNAAAQKSEVILPKG